MFTTRRAVTVQNWIGIYSIQALPVFALPAWYYEIVGPHLRGALQQQNGLPLPDLSRYGPNWRRLPLLMSTAAATPTLKPEMAQALFQPRQVPQERGWWNGAKHNPGPFRSPADEYSIAR